RSESPAEDARGRRHQAGRCRHQRPGTVSSGDARRPGAGTADPATLAQFARRRMREKIPQLERALAGHFAAHQRFMAAQQPAHIDYLDDAIAQVSSEVAERLAPFETTIDRLDVVPGIGRRTAEI